MKNKTLILLLFLMGSFVFTNAKSSAPEKINQETHLPEFHTIKIIGDIKLYIHSGHENVIKSEINSGLSSELHIEVQEGVLTIRLDKPVNRFDMPKLELRCIGFDALYAEGNYYLKMEDLLLTKNLQLNLKGNGLVNLNIDVQELRADISGSTVAALKGKVADAKIYAQKESYWAALHLNIDRLLVSASGNAKAEVLAHQEIIAIAEQSGQINCAGKAEIRSYIQGLGSVNKLPSL